MTLRTAKITAGPTKAMRPGVPRQQGVKEGVNEGRKRRRGEGRGERRRRTGEKREGKVGENIPRPI